MVFKLLQGNPVSPEDTLDRPDTRGRLITRIR
jgi:hypothetical protein